MKQVIGYISNIIGTENVKTLMKFANNIVGFIKEKYDGKSNLKAHKQENKAYEEVASVDEKVIIYTDGACRGNGQENTIGAYGIVLMYGEHKKK